MKHKTLVTALALAVMVAVSAAAAEEDPFLGKPHAPVMHRLDWAQAVAKELNIPVIVDFYADW